MFRLAAGAWLGVGVGATVCGLLRLELGRSDTDIADGVRDIEGG